MEYHINDKERLAAKFPLKTFVKVPDAHVKLLSDNSNMHSDKSELCHSSIFEVSVWAVDKNLD